MPAQVITSVENNFTKGLITEATGLNFPENAAVSASNTEFTLIGDVIRREGINFELNGTTTPIDRTLQAMSSYVWNNPGGDGNSKLLVKQIGQTLYFYNIAAATVASPLSTQLLAGIAVLTGVNGGSVDITKECTYADGNGYLFVYHTSCDPSYVTYNAGTQAIVITPITVQIRDFIGVVDGLAVNIRPTTLSDDHNYNLQNQGWTTAAAWQAHSSINLPYNALGHQTFPISPTLASGPANGQQVFCYGNIPNLLNAVTLTGTIIATAGSPINSITVNVTGFVVTSGAGGLNYSIWTIVPISTGYITTWFGAEGNYPSNADVWWYFKNSSGVFDPTTQANVQLNTGQAPQGHYILPAFNLDRNAISGLTTLTAVTTTMRPTQGAWFQGRVWYTGLSAYQAASGDANFYTWTENIYYSTTIITPSDFGVCYQTNDPTAETLNGELPTDGGYLSIVGSGTIHKLFPIANGLLVFANNGVWFITGSQGIGFASNDFTVTQISKIKILSSHSFIDVNGLPYFWNEEGIYQVIPDKSGQLTVEPITVGTILSFYNNIPLASKKYARGSYDPINYTIQWCYRSTIESSVTDRYQFDSILNYNNYNKAFFPYTISTGSNTQYIHGINYISYPYISNATPDPGFKYHCSKFVSPSYFHGFAEEYDTTYQDWGSADFTSVFVTGYKVHGQALKKTQIPYVYVYSRNSGYAAYYIQAAWDYGITFDSNRWSQPQFVELNDANAAMITRRHRLRGQGYVLQLMFTSVKGQPFDIMGWALYETMNAGV